MIRRALEQGILSMQGNIEAIRDNFGPLHKMGIAIAAALPGVIVALWTTNQWVRLAGVVWVLLNILPALLNLVMGE